MIGGKGRVYIPLFSRPQAGFAGVVCAHNVCWMWEIHQQQFTGTRPWAGLTRVGNQHTYKNNIIFYHIQILAQFSCPIQHAEAPNYPPSKLGTTGENLTYFPWTSVKRQRYVKGRGKNEMHQAVAACCCIFGETAIPYATVNDVRIGVNHRQSTATTDASCSSVPT